MKRFTFIVVIFLCSLLISCQEEKKPRYFVPPEQIDGIGISRANMTNEILGQRTRQMIESQTFVILRHPESLEGAKRVVSSKKLQSAFRKAERVSSFPKKTLEAICFLESWGLAVQSPTGPKGPMQIAEGTAKQMGLKIERGTRYKIVSKRIAVKVRTKKGKKIRYITKRQRIPYQTIIRDDRMVPELAIPAAAQYLQRLEGKFGGRDLAIAAYHCGEGGTNELINLAKGSSGISGPITMSEIFFKCSPAYNRPLYLGVKKHLARDSSPTYWFRIKRAEELLTLYRQSPGAFRELWKNYQSPIKGRDRVPSRLWLWVKKDDLKYKIPQDLQDAGLVQLPNNPDYFGFLVRNDVGKKDPNNRKLYEQISKEAAGAIIYIAYETRRLVEASGGKFTPLEITSLVRTLAYQKILSRSNVNARIELPTHCSGMAFDISYKNISSHERECLKFILDDLEWAGALDATMESLRSMTFHIGVAPAYKDFFSKITLVQKNNL
ncbi:MAG: DUF5715 family protein [Patescibacteria group bacterium]|nr:DUF5715 family protein [Patescibacteria group bacterium]